MFPPQGAGGGGGQLDSPPPSPTAMGGGDPEAGSVPTLSQFAGPQPIGSANLPPEILTGILQSAEKIGEMLDSYAQVTPDLAPDWALLKDMLQRTLGKVLVAGGNPTSATAPGSPFPGGGFSRAMPQ